MKKMTFSSDLVSGKENEEEITEGSQEVVVRERMQPSWVEITEKLLGTNIDPISVNTQVLANEIWELVMPTIEKYRDKIYFDVDRLKVSRYCDMYAHWLKAKLFIEKYGSCFTLWGDMMTIDPETQEVKSTKFIKSVKEYPQTRQYERLSRELSQLENSLGFDPMARIKISGLVNRNKIIESKFQPPAKKISGKESQDDRQRVIQPFNYRLRNQNKK